MWMKFLVWKNGYVGRRKIFLDIRSFILNGKYRIIAPNILKVKFLTNFDI